METVKPADIYIEYWSDNTDKHQYSKLSQRSRRHHFELINLLPNELYRLKVHGRIGDAIYEKDAGVFQTDSLPGNLPSFVVLKDQYRFDDYVMMKTSPRFGNEAQHAMRVFSW